MRIARVPISPEKETDVVLRSISQNKGVVTKPLIAIAALVASVPA